MAVYNTVVVSVDDWIDLNAAAGLAVGSACVIQNISPSNCYLVDSATKPIRADGAVIFNPSYGQLSIAGQAAGYSVRVQACRMFH